MASSNIHMLEIKRDRSRNACYTVNITFRKNKLFQWLTTSTVKKLLRYACLQKGINNLSMTSGTTRPMEEIFRQNIIKQLNILYKKVHVAYTVASEIQDSIN